MQLLVVLLASVQLVQRQAVVGQVVTADENNYALPGISICVAGTRICTWSEGNGRFALAGFEPTDRVELTTEMAGFQTGEHTVSICRDQMTTVILAMPVMAGSDCTYRGPSEAMKYGVQGTIVSAGITIARARLTLRDRSHKIFWTGHSSRRGTFAAAGLAQGDYALDVSKAGYQLQRVSFKMHYCHSQEILRIPLLKACR